MNGEQSGITLARPTRSPAQQVPQSWTGSHPRRTLEIVQRTWAEVLDVSAVGPHDDFFDLGGNSLIVAAALATLGPRVGMELPLRALFEAPTPAEMTELIAERRGVLVNQSRNGGFTPFLPNWVVPLQRAGTGRPVWVVPGGIGGVWTLKRDAQVAALVGTSHPFYGFQREPPQLDLRRDDWIPATAASYIEQMRGIQGSGPFLLYGICSGGPLAWEVASQLLAQGERVAGLLLYESALPPDFATMTPPARGRRQLPHYVPSLLPVDVTLLMTEVWHARDRSAGWRQVIGGKLTTVVMPGDTPGAHNLYVNREAMIAGHLRDWIDRAHRR